MSKNLLQALGKIDVALGGQTNDAANVIQALNQISERAGNLKNSMEEINSVDIKILSANEYDSETGLPTIQNPDESTFYLVPSGDEEGNNLFNEYYYNGESWELFGSGGLKLDDLVVVAGTGTGSAMTKNGNTASGANSFAEGSNTTASGAVSHAEGVNTTASGYSSHVEGQSTIANHKSQHVFGEFNTQDSSTAVATDRGNYVEIVGNGTSTSVRSNARTLDWNGNEVLAGKLTVGSGPVNNMDVATKQYVDENSGGLQNLVDGSATGSVRGVSTAAEDSSYTMGQNAVAEGGGTKASGNYSHAEGGGTTASNSCSHAEGSNTIASGPSSHAEGSGTTASDNCSHAEGINTTASGSNSHAEGYYTTANHDSQHVFGAYNIIDPSTATANNRGNYVEIVGNGTSSSAKSNARTLDWSGNESLAGSLTLGMGTADEITITATQLKSLLALLNT